MYSQQINNGVVKPASEAQDGFGINESTVQEFISGSMIADYDQQLADISDGMRDILKEKQMLRAEIAELSTMTTRPVKNVDGKESILITSDEAEMAGLAGQGVTVKDKKGNVTGYYVEKDVVTDAIKTAIDIKKGNLEGLNSNSELTMIKIQQLVNLRKNAMMMLSNLISSNTSTMQQIISNFKN